ncbi:urease accessory protein UreD [Barrientosiimonas marina]|uniref:Urease accessory protein UreD n=1 Tax=Lentibacillus kimchii TaxID=1542911 RepID=A0ABW2UU13_9BACI
MAAWTGDLQLSMKNKRGTSVPETIYFQGAFKLMRPKYYDDSGQPCYFILNPGGGYVDGDRYRMSFTLEKNAELLLTTQAATKIYRTPNKPVTQETTIVLNEGSLLEYIPDPIIAYNKANYKQTNIIHMKTGSTLIYSDIITPGWSPDGSLFSYENIQVKNTVYLNDQLAVFDHLKLNPATDHIQDIGMMEGFSHLGSMLVVNEDLQREHIEALTEQFRSDAADCKLGFSELMAPGFSVRILANQTQVIERILSEIHSYIREHLFSKKRVFLRKY